MPKSAREHCLVARPYVPESAKPSTGWTGVPGARHVPDSKDPAFARFTFIAGEWTTAGIDMTDEVMAAAAKLAQHQVQREKQRDAMRSQQDARVAAGVAAFTPKPGEFGDEANGFVYYVRRDSFVKIGTTTRLRKRMRALMPDEVLAVEPGSYTRERALHEQFAADRISPDCEYFRITKELLDHIAETVTRHGAPPEGLSQLRNYQ